MFRYLLLALLLGNLAAPAQKYSVFKGDTINRSDAKGRKQGVWKRYYANDTLFSEGQYKDGKAIGTFRTFYKNGKQQAIMTYRGMTERCDAIVYAEAGHLMAKGVYQSQKKDSVWCYFSEQGKLQSLEQYQKGKKEGKWEVFYPEGNPSQTLFYKADKKNGLYKEFFKNGKTKIEGVMKNDAFEGKVTVYHPSGKVWQQGVYKNGVKDGKWIVLDEAGKTEREEIYKSGFLLNPVAEPETPIAEPEK